MTMTCVVGDVSREARSTSIPSTAPIRTSVRTTSNGSAVTRWIAAAPSSASATAYPASRSTIAVVARMLRWSSTTRTLAAAGGAFACSPGPPAVAASLIAPSSTHPAAHFNKVVARAGRPRQVQREGGAAAAGSRPHLDPAMVAVHDALHDREPEPGAGRPRGEERLEDPVPHLVRDAAARVRQLDDGRVAVDARAHRERPALRHGLDRVHDHVHDGLPQEGGVDRHRGEVGRGVALDRDAVAGV